MIDGMSLFLKVTAYYIGSLSKASFIIFSSDISDREVLEEGVLEWISFLVDCERTHILFHIKVLS